MDAYWTEINASSNPGRLSDAGMTYDASAGYVVLFGGMTYYNSGIEWNCTNSTWTYRAGVWTNLSIPGPPTQLACSPLMAFDPSTGSVIAYLYPNAAPNSVPSTLMTWEFANGTWTNLNVSSPRIDVGTMAYYAPAKAVVLVGVERIGRQRI
ncbi:hypothetical protein B2A_08926 [mine drainage metagenome]|uniref:Uncharacterized protein n=1 Tax=mine drainage metagenome TaxID=410659 RepID=T0ZNS9_9ZZZZ